jgi:hypothetical protein
VLASSFDRGIAFEMALHAHGIVARRWQFREIHNRVGGVHVRSAWSVTAFTAYARICKQRTIVGRPSLAKPSYRSECQSAQRTQHVQLFIDFSSSESTLLLDRIHKNPPLNCGMREHGSYHLELRFVADAISQFVADTMNQHDWQLIGAIIGDRDSIVSTRQAKAWDNLSHPRAARIIPSIFMRIPHISKRGRPICPRSTGTITSSKLLILGWLNERPSWNSTCT